jgi:hypothetical protein
LTGCPGPDDRDKKASFLQNPQSSVVAGWVKKYTRRSHGCSWSLFIMGLGYKFLAKYAVFLLASAAQEEHVLSQTIKNPYAG